ncbi:MAG TPA: CoA pyrophosphatase, partial [Herpetosiphonaceae bacterium]
RRADAPAAAPTPMQPISLTSPALLARLRREIERADEDHAARVRLVPQFPDGSPARAMQPPADTAPGRGAVLIALYPQDGELLVPLTVRSAALRTHQGEVSFPGGSADPEDGTLEITALREAEEELGLDRRLVEIWGPLSDVYISVSKFQIRPFVCWAAAPPPLTAAPDEVAAVVHLPLRRLLGPESVQVEERLIRGQAVKVPFYPFGEHKIWGATSIILSQLAARLQAAIDSE